MPLYERTRPLLAENTPEEAYIGFEHPSRMVTADKAGLNGRRGPLSAAVLSSKETGLDPVVEPTRGSYD